MPGDSRFKNPLLRLLLLMKTDVQWVGEHRTYQAGYGETNDKRIFGNVLDNFFCGIFNHQDKKNVGVNSYNQIRKDIGARNL